MAVAKLIKIKLAKGWPGVYGQVCIFRKNLIKSCGRCHCKIFTKISKDGNDNVFGWCINCKTINNLGKRKLLSYSLQTEEIVSRTKK